MSPSAQPLYGRTLDGVGYMSQQIRTLTRIHARLLSPLGFLFGFAAGQASLRPSAAPTSRFTTTRWVASHSQLVHGAMGAESSPTGDIVAVLEYVEKGGVNVLRLAFHFCVS